MITLGIDIGTRFVKSCIVNGGTLCGAAIYESDRKIENVIKATCAEAFKEAGIKRNRIKRVIATGYGSHTVKKAHYIISEPHCIARAVHALNGGIETAIDVGGLFINVIAINRNGSIDDSLTNERCAAGSGKFLEMVSESIGISIPEISDHALKSNNPYRIQSSCAVFAESEIISRINTGGDDSDILAGLLVSIAIRITTLLDKIDSKGDIALTGGLSKIEAFRIIFKEQTEKNIIELNLDSQLFAAFGAALIAQGNRLNSANSGI